MFAKYQYAILNGRIYKNGQRCGGTDAPTLKDKPKLTEGQTHMSDKKTTTAPKIKRAPIVRAATRPQAKATAPAMSLKALERKLDSIEQRLALLGCPSTWDQALAFICKRDGCGLVEAGRRACKEYPSLHPAARR